MCKNTNMNLRELQKNNIEMKADSVMFKDTKTELALQ